MRFCCAYCGNVLTYLCYFCVQQVQKDDLVPHLLVLPPGTDLHDHPLVMNGSIFMQVSVPVKSLRVVLLKSKITLSFWF